MPLIGDFDGDGKDDLVAWYPASGNWEVALSKAVKFVPTQGPGSSSWLQNWATGSTWVPLVGNFDGKGPDDIAVWNPANGDWEVALSDGTQFTPARTPWLQNWATGSTWVPLVGNFDGKGPDDIAVWNPANGDWEVALSDGTQFTPARTPWLQNWATGSTWVPLVGDFNGDDVDDIAVWNPANGDWEVALSDGTQFTPARTPWLQNWAKGSTWVPLVGDFNGDDVDDIAVWNPATGEWQVALNEGGRFVPTKGTGSGFWLTNWPQGKGWVPFVGDFNGDGKDDVVVWHSGNGDWQVAISEGSRFISRKPRSLLARQPGFSDLYVVRDEWARYEAGEIAHIENVMATETRERSHTRLTENEETLTIDEERSKLDERDTQTTDRFDLHTESSRDTSLNIAVDGSVDTSGQYGPTEVTTHLGGNLDYSLNESQSQATTTAHETVARAVTRVEEKVRQVRTTRSLSRIEEVNKHAFTNNKDNAQHIVGMYRWVDKIKWVQIFRYPNRFLLEFQIPEPGAWLRWLLDNKKPPMVSECPDAFEIEIIDPNTNEKKLVKLSPAHVTAQNYLELAARYKTPGVTPPPEKVLVSAAYTKDTTNPRDTAVIKKDDPVRYVKLTDITIKSGYVAKQWYARIKFVGEESFEHYYPAGTVIKSNLEINIGNSELSYQGSDNSSGFNQQVGPISIITVNNTTPGIEQVGLPVSITLDNNRGYSIHIIVECEPSATELMKWQISTYEKVAAAYYAMKRMYDEELAARNIRAGVTIKGQSPLQNAEMARVEIKKSVIEMLYGEDFKGRNAMDPRFDINKKPVSPEINLEEAMQNAPEIQFIEQAFEWENLTYVLYPYFWTGRDQWEELADLNSEDPDFARFLRAGSARVIVPARPGFEWPSWLYVYTGIMWGGGPAPGPEDEEYLSVVDEIQAQQKPPRDGIPGESWEVRLPTTLIWLDNVNSSLPIDKQPKTLDTPPGKVLP